MAFSRLSYGKVWTNAQDFPSYESSETQVRADMQYHPDAVKDFLNSVLLGELESGEGAGLIGDKRKGTVALTLEDIYKILDTHAEDIKDLAGGETPESLKGVRVTFSLSDWTLSDDGSYYKIVLSKDQHKRTSTIFSYVLSCLSGGAYKKNTWATAGTDVLYSASEQKVTLRSNEPYAGAVAFFGV